MGDMREADRLVAFHHAGKGGLNLSAVKDENTDDNSGMVGEDRLAVMPR